MKSWWYLAVSLISFTLVGCESGSIVPGESPPTVLMSNTTPIPKEANKLLSLSTPCCKSFADLPYRELKLESSFESVMDGSYPTFNFDSGKSFFVALQLPKSNRPLSVEIQSVAAEDRVFAPTVVVLDSNFQPTRTFNSDYFKYKTASMFRPERLEGYLDGVAGFKDETYIVIYSTSDSLVQSTQMIHPAKQFAKGRNLAIPDIPDPFAKHSPLGVLAVYVTPTSIDNREEKAPQQFSKEKEVAADIYINEQIRRAVAEGRIEEAMHLVEDAEANGSTTARKTFIDAVKKQ